MTAVGPVIASTSIGPGHDGHAEVVVELLYPNGGRAQLSVAQGVVAATLDACGMTNLDQLVGRPWTDLAAGLPHLLAMNLQ